MLTSRSQSTTRYGGPRMGGQRWLRGRVPRNHRCELGHRLTRVYVLKFARQESIRGAIESCGSGARSSQHSEPLMTRIIRTVLLLATLTILPLSAAVAATPTKDHVVEVVKQAVAFYKANG